MIEDQRNPGRLPEPVDIISEDEYTNQAVSETNKHVKDQSVLCMSNYVKDTRQLPPGDNLMENMQKAKPIKIVQHEIEDQKSRGRLPRHLDTPSENKEALQEVSEKNKHVNVKDQADVAHDSDDQEIEFRRYTSITKGIRNRENVSLRQADVAHDSDDQEIEFKRYTSITKVIDNRENVTLPQNDSVCASPESKLVETECLADVYKPSILCAEQTMWTPLNDSGIVAESSLSIIDTDSENDVVKENQQDSRSSTTCKQSSVVKQKYQKPPRPCLFCNKAQTQLKRHILKKHKGHPEVEPILSMNMKEQDLIIAQFRRRAIKQFNLALIKEGGTDFMRERKGRIADNDIIICSGCEGFFAKKYKNRHQLVCPASGSNIMLPMVSLTSSISIENSDDDFKNLLNSLQLDTVGDYIKTDPIVLMIGARTFAASKRKKDKVTETRRTTRSRMRLTTRLYLCFREICKNQSEITLPDTLGNAADMYRRKTISLLGRAVNTLSDRSLEDRLSVTDQKSGLKVSILNLLKATGKLLIGYFLMQELDARSQQVVEFLQVLKLYEDEIFGDAYYDLNYRRNVSLRKPVNLPKDDDIKMLMGECTRIMSVDVFNYPHDSFVNIRSATATCLIIFNARRGGEPVRLQLYQWQEAINGQWVDKEDLPTDFDEDTMLVTYQTGKGSDHLVPVIFPPESLSAMKFLTKEEVRKDAGVHPNNRYIFASTQNSESHASGWHCINDILKKLSLSGALNATKNRHRVASLLAKLKLSEKEKDLIYKHFGHSEKINQNVYQAPPGSQQLRHTGKRLLEINNMESSSSLKEKDALKKNKSTDKKVKKSKVLNPARTINSTSSKTVINDKVKTGEIGKRKSF